VENSVPAGDIVSGNVDIRLEIGKGSLPNQVVIAQLHYIVDEEGTVKADVAYVRNECPGGGTATPTATASATATPTATAKAQSRP
jgi:hypothetical protein